MNAGSTTTPSAAQHAINDRLYRQRDLVPKYSTTKLNPAEAVALIRHGEHVQHSRVLDLGCGAGRLAAYLRPLVPRYIGIDISPYMIAHCRRLYPELRFEQGDMRDLSLFPDESFDLVLGVSNLFDAVSHEERLKVLREVRRVLARGGLLIFSAHNRNYVDAGAGPRLEFHRNPLTQLRLIADYLQTSANHRRIKPFHRFEPEYALLNDSGNNYHSLHYYITRERQARQLEDEGFTFLECLGEDGLTLASNASGRQHASLLYVARKA